MTKSESNAAGTFDARTTPKPTRGSRRRGRRPRGHGEAVSAPTSESTSRPLGNLAAEQATAPATEPAAAPVGALSTAPATGSAAEPAAAPRAYHRTHLQQLESEAIYLIRETAAQFEQPVLLFSGGKDSIVLCHLARKAFWPGTLPFPLLHIDTGHNFPETLEFRDKLMERWRVRLLVRHVQDSIDRGRVTEENVSNPSRNGLQTVTLLDALKELRVDAALGGARRDEEKARAKERFFSHRDRFGQWDPRNQRPELWNLLNGCRRPGEHFRVFPLSNWTELDIWEYVAAEGLELPSLYFSHMRRVVRIDGVLLAHAPHIDGLNGDCPEERRVRFRTIGDLTCTGAVESDAGTVEEIIAEVAANRMAERSARSDDKRSEAAMEDRKRLGYF